MRILLLVAALVILAGCAARERYIDPKHVEGPALADLTECRRQAAVVTPTAARAIYDSCMTNRGYVPAVLGSSAGQETGAQTPARTPATTRLHP